MTTPNTASLALRDLAECRAKRDGADWSTMTDQARADYLGLARITLDRVDGKLMRGMLR